MEKKMNGIERDTRSSFLIMVADDEDFNRDMILQGIKKAGFRCLSAVDAYEALGILEKNHIDVVIANINMPGKNGIELTKTIKDKFDSGIIILTDRVQDLDCENIISQAGIEFIRKPVNLDELELRLQRVLRERIMVAEQKKVEEENRRALQKLRKSIIGSIHAMAMTIEIRDPYTAGHQRRVANLSRAIGKELCLSPIQIEGLGMAGVIHDIGKISIPSEILSKPGNLNKLEFDIMKTHPQVGYDILKSIEFPWPLAEITLQHHERLDGSGYPQGLIENEIIFEAKILSVADVVEAMVSARPFRPARDIHFAIDEISKRRRIAYDPQVVDACVHLLKKKDFTF
jgi:putative two-component system response regulator